MIYRVNTKHSLISSSYKIKTYWNIFYKYRTADTLTQEIFNFSARRQRAVKCKMALTSQQRGWCVLEFHKTNSVVTVQRAFTCTFNVDPPTKKSILKWHRPTVGLGAAVISVTPDMLQGVWSELHYRIDVCRVTRGGTLSVRDTT